MTEDHPEVSSLLASMGRLWSWDKHLVVGGVGMKSFETKASQNILKGCSHWPEALMKDQKESFMHIL